ncbi:recombinase family protein, partial [Staphylococcus aureus]
LLGDHYDDGGVSGASLKRPALQVLLSDIRAGKIDVVVVYKVDRLTRSLAEAIRKASARTKARSRGFSIGRSVASPL